MTNLTRIQSHWKIKVWSIEYFTTVFLLGIYNCHKGFPCYSRARFYWGFDMKKFILLTFVAFIIATQASADFPKRVMDCKVTDQVILHSDEGKPNRGTNFVNKFEIGDKLRFELSSTFNARLYAELRDTKRDDYVIGTDIGEKYKEFTLMMGYLNDKKGILGNRFSEDHIRLESLFKELELKRYYKSDFHGILITKAFGRLLARVATLDCRMVQDDFDKILAGFPEE